MPRLLLPDRVRDRARALGPDGAAWLAALPDLLASVARDWSLTLGDPMTGGSTSLVMRATDGDGRPVVVKLAQPDAELDDQAATLARAQGRGYAKLLAYDPDRSALLLEGLGPSLETLNYPPERILVIMCDVLTEAWQVPRATEPVSPDPDKATALARFISEAWPELGRPCSPEVIDRALSCAERRAAAFDLAGSVVVHGDPHPANALRVPAPRAGAGSGFVFVDPDGFLADRGYDLGVLLRDWHRELANAEDPTATLRRFCRLLADRTGVDSESIWEWGFLERVSTGLYCLRYGAPPLGHALLASAERLG